MTKGEGRREKSILTHPSSLKIGVLALQGAVEEHLKMVEKCGAEGLPIKKPEELSEVQALIIPGGESTAIGRLMLKQGFREKIKTLAKNGFPIYGTCAGLILLSQKIVPGSQEKNENKPPLLKLMAIEVKRNAFGPQKESFETELEIPEIGKKPFRAVFIRAPWIEKANSTTKVMAKFNGKIVMARNGKLLVTAFHPELTNDTRIHQYFLEKVAKEV